MAASGATVRAIIEVVRHHIDDKTWRKILDDLETVPGNASFRETIQRLRQETK